MAEQVHGVNPVMLLDQILRSKVFNCQYYKAHCFALDAESIVDRAVDITHVGGTYGGMQKPTPFLCLTLKLLQIQPEREVVLEYLRQEEFKYLTALGALYVRLTCPAKDVYTLLEPLYNDFRKLRYRKSDGSTEITHMDEFADDLLRSEVACSTVLPLLPRRQTLEETQSLPVRISALQDEIEWVEETQPTAPRARSRSRQKREDLGAGGKNPQKLPNAESDEYWINLRAQLGLKPVSKSEEPKFPPTNSRFPSYLAILRALDGFH